MPSFKSNIFAMLLISQVCWASAIDADVRRASLVRKSGMDVDADGTVKPSNHKSGNALSAGSLVGMSVSANAEADLLSDYKQDASLSTRVQNILNEVQEMSRSGASPAPHKSKDIQGIVKDELLPGLHKERDFAEAQVTSSVAAIAKCNEDSVSKQALLKAGPEVEVDKARKTHVACRGKEKEKHSTKNSKCAELDGYLDTVQVPQELPTGRGRDEMVEYVSTMNKYFCPMEPKVSEMDEACKTAENEHSKHRTGCNRNQFVFESDFCSWRTELGDACTASSDCYTNAVSSYSTVKTNTETLVKKLKVEFSALKKIMCYLDVWLSDNNAETVNADQFDKCNGASVDSSAMDVQFPDAPAQAACPMTAAETYPGTPTFASTEYDAFPKYVVETIPCPSTGASASAATAAAAAASAAAAANVNPSTGTAADVNAAADAAAAAAAGASSAGSTSRGGYKR